jgi:tRNA (guanine37-N1)-methyltransferase
MRFDIITIHPELLSGPFSHSILKRAQDKGLVEVHFHDLRQYTLDKHRKVDDYQFGGGAGMVMTIEPIDRCISALKAERDYDEVIFMTPDGEQFDQPMANRLSSKGNMILLCGHYKGIDERVREHMIRLIPGVISDETSALFDSHQDGMLAPPVYTRPAEYKGWKVPGILLSGNDKKVEDWRNEQAIKRTEERRPGYLDD